MSIDRTKKAGLAEIFAAITGICEVGVSLVKKQQSNVKHPLSLLAYEGIELSWNAKTDLTQAVWDRETPASVAQLQDKWAQKCISFLEQSAKTLAANSETRLEKPFSKKLGGSCVDLCEHIGDMVARESLPQRQVVHLHAGGIPVKPMNMPYLAGAADPAPYESSMEASRKKGGRPPKNKAAERQPAFV